MNKTFDKALVEYIFDAFKGFEILPNVKIIDYEWVPDEDNIRVLRIFFILRFDTNETINLHEL